MECPICMEECKDVTTTLCGHTFCNSCISNVVITTLSCPLCRSMLIDEIISKKVLNESIRYSLTSVSKKKQKLYWKGFNKIQTRVDTHLISPDDMGSVMISLLMAIVGKPALHFMKMEMLDAVLHRDTYLESLYEDWSLMFVKD